ncbi:DNA mismatch repair protein MutT [Pseudoalteromonas sp. BMB]|nr:DNA mismatch repair protein MutT [Pseudoalteromonas sp. BMB]
MCGNSVKTRLQNREIKVCPLIIRESGDFCELLLFKHPQADVQLVKGTVELTDKSLENAALRELEEESGISNVLSTEYMGSWESGFQNQVWHFVLCKTSEKLPDSWSFYTQDDGGHEFQFFWHKLGEPLHFKCHQVFFEAIKQVESMQV